MNQSLPYYSSWGECRRRKKGSALAMVATKNSGKPPRGDPGGWKDHFKKTELHDGFFFQDHITKKRRESSGSIDPGGGTTAVGQGKGKPPLQRFRVC